jgi:hypothetical protein
VEPSGVGALRLCKPSTEDVSNVCLGWRIHILIVHLIYKKATPLPNLHKYFTVSAKIRFRYQISLSMTTRMPHVQVRGRYLWKDGERVRTVCRVPDTVYVLILC